MCQVNNERERNILGEEEDQIGREPIRCRRMRKEKEKEKKEERKEKEKEKEREKKRKNKKYGECVRVRGKRDGERRKKEEKGTKLPFAISDEPVVEMRRGKRQSWSTQRELHVGTKSKFFVEALRDMGFLLYRFLFI